MYQTFEPHLATAGWGLFCYSAGMTRINSHQLVQRVDDDLVIVDESTGEEVLIKGADFHVLHRALLALGVVRHPVAAEDSGS